MTDAPPWPLYALALVLGLVFGSFINVIVHRGPTLWGLVDGKRGDLMSPRSYCPACKTPIAASRLVPIASFLLQQGRCAACGGTISLRYPVVEALGALVAVSAVAVFGANITALAAAIFGWSLVALAFIDLETGYLPDAITLPLIAAGLAANAFGLFVPLVDAFIGAVAGYAVFRLIGFLFARVRNKEGLGQGDAKLLAAVGAWTGWTALPLVVLIAALATLLVALIGRQERGSLSEPAPFGPGLCTAGFIALLAGPLLTGP